MRRFVFALVVICAVALGIAYYMDWFKIATLHEEGRTIVQFEFYTGRMHDATENAEEKAKKIGDRIEERAKDRAAATTVKGTVASIDAANRCFVLMPTDRGEMTVYLEPTTRISGSQLSGLRTGDHVSVTYEGHDGKNIASDIAVEHGT